MNYLNHLAKELQTATNEKASDTARRIAEVEGTSVNYYYVAKSLGYFVESMRPNGVVGSRVTEIVKGTFGTDQATEIILTHRKRTQEYKKAKKAASSQPAADEPVQQQLPMNGTLLKEATMEQIVEELKRRGYEGKLLKMLEVVV